MHIEPDRDRPSHHSRPGAPTAFDAAASARLGTRSSHPARASHRHPRAPLAEPAGAPAANSDAPRERAGDQSDELMRATFDLAPVGIAHVALDGRLLLANAHLCSLLGYTNDELLARPFRDITHPDDREADRALAERLCAEESPPVALEKRYIRKDGTMLWTALTASLARDPQGTPRHFIVIIEDINARKRVEAEHTALLARERASAERLRALQAITDTALAHVALDDLMPRLLDRVLEALRADYAAILLLDEREQTLSVRAARGTEIAGDSRVRVTLGRGIAGAILAECRPLVVDDLTATTKAGPRLREHLRSLAGVPLMVNGQAVGVVQVGTTIPRHFSDEDVSLLERAAERAALAIGQARLYEAARLARDEAAARAAQLAATIESMADGVIVHDGEGRVLHANSAARTLLGLETERGIASSRASGGSSGRWTLRDARGRRLSEDRMPLFRVLRGETLTGANAVDVSLTAQDGREAELSLSAAPVLDAANQPAGGVLIFRDVTERRHLERRTAEALQALLAMAESLVAPTSPDVGPGDTLDTSNPEADMGGTVARLAELTRSVLGCHRVALVSIDPATGEMHARAAVGFAPQHELAWQRSVEGIMPERRFAAQELARLGDGEVWAVGDGRTEAVGDWHLYFAPHAALLAPLLVRGQLAGLLALDHDTSAHAYPAEETALAAAAAKLAALVVERERLLREREEARASELALRAANKQMDDFLSMASHELRTPLTSIKAYIQVAQRRLRQRSPTEMPDEPTAPLSVPLASQIEAALVPLERANEHSDVLNRLVGDLLDASRIQAHRLEIRLGACDLAPLVRAAVEEQLMAWPTRILEVDFATVASAPIRGDAARLKQVVTNYLTNAIKYAPVDRPIVVGLGVEDGWAKAWVRDEGPGLPPEEQARIWDRFHRTAGMRVQNGADGGLGLGLYICRGIIELHDGRVGVESVPGVGSTFYFALPLTPAD